MGALGSRLLDGRGVSPNTEEGERWLRKAAEAGEGQAMRVLGSRLLDGRGVSPNAEEGEQWLRKAAEAGDSSARLNLGYFIYRRAIVQGDPPVAYREAGCLFLAAWEEDRSAANNLAYMVRRGEFTAEGLNVEILLSDLVNEDDTFALVNLALHIIRASSTAGAWEEADALLARAVASSGIAGVVGWWTGTAQRGDPEGVLVTALLWRHGYGGADPDQVAAWWDIAGAADWTILPERRGRYAPNSVSGPKE